MGAYEDSFDAGGLPDIRVIADRQRGLLRSVGDLSKWRREVDKDRATQGQSIDALIEDVKVVKRLLIGLMISVVTGSASITIAILLATRKG